MNKELIQLKIRESICLNIIKVLDEKCSNDPRYPDAIKEYNRQLESIRSKIKGMEAILEHKEESIELMQKVISGKPPSTVIGLKTAKMFGEVAK